MVHAAKLDADSLITARQKGAFYSSTGVSLDDIHLDQSNRRLQLKIRPKPNMKYRSELHGTLKNYDRTIKQVPSPAGDPQPIRLQHGDDIGILLASSISLEPLYQLTGDELYVRAVIVSDQIRTNSCNPRPKATGLHSADRLVRDIWSFWGYRRRLVDQPPYFSTDLLTNFLFY